MVNSIRLVVLVASLVLLVSPIAAQTVGTGQTSGGAYYSWIVPDGWTPADGLVIWNHGFSLAPIAPNPDLGPLVDVQLAEGYAVAASSYSLTGWAVFESHLDNQEMVEAFADEFGTPEQVLITGASLGGIVTARDVEEGRIPNVVGAMPICGALGGSRVWDGGADVRLLYDAICSEVPGAAIPGGVFGVTDPTFGEQALGAALQACFGIVVPELPPTAEQAARLQKFLDVTGLPVEFVATDMGFATFGMADLVLDPRKMAGLPPFSNSGVDYGDAEIDATIQRVEAPSGVRSEFFENYTPSGRVEDVKIVAIHTDKDGLVVVENLGDYAEKVPANRLTTGIIVEDTPSHCNFTAAETVAAWESLRGWVAGLPQPDAATLQATCEGIVLGGLAEGPCRYDPDFELLDFVEGNRVRPRQQCDSSATELCLEDRFEVTVRHGAAGTPARVGAIETTNSGSFWFFDADNIELLVKALDGRQINGEQWIFYGSLTSVEFEMTVVDTETGLVRVYENSDGTFASFGDIEAFP